MRLVFGIFKPRQPILGSELAGVIESIGNNVRKFKVGDAVFAFSDYSMGCYAQYKCMPESGAIALKPANLSFDESAGLSFGATTALSFFKKGNLQKGETVLINGASGAVGIAALQLARHIGAVVTAVCSTANVELMRSLGADHVIDYSREDFTKNGQTYDVVLDAVGTASFARSKSSLKEKGRLLMVLAGLPDMLKIPWVWITSNKKIYAGSASWRPEDLGFLATMAEAGDFKSVIDRRYPFEQISEAHRYVDTGRKKGIVVVTLV